MSVVAKGIRHALLIQKRFHWEPRRALVVGAACSAVAGVVALVLARRSEGGPPAADARPPSAAPTSGTGAARPTLALLIAFVSGLTSLGYQVLWTRLLSSGTGNSTYVFTLILGMFLIGITIGALLFSANRHRIRQPVVLIALAQVIVAAVAIAGLVLVIGQPGKIDPGNAMEAAKAILLPITLVVLPATIVMGFTFPAA